jgi:hypothetical protein
MPARAAKKVVRGLARKGEADIRWLLNRLPREIAEAAEQRSNRPIFFTWR